MKNPFNLTPSAKTDLHRIWNYTLETWGEAQADRYISNLFERFAWLAKRPRIGTHRTDIGDGYYSFPQSSHLVFYLISDDGIDIIGVPHKEMDATGYFDART